MFPEQSVPQVLYDYFTNNQNCSYRKYHDLLTPKSSSKKVIVDEYAKLHPTLLSDFLFSTMDEVRVRKANEFAEKVLFTANMQDADYFRRSVLRREIVGDIDYNKHRDHASHTVNNYLLGWYIFDKIKAIKDAFKAQIKKNYIKDYDPSDEEITTFFGNTWLLVSLLHDIGYIFEGSLHTLDTESYNDKIRRGSTIIHDYFHHRFWFDLNIDSQSERQVLNKILNLESENFADVKSLVSLGDILLSVGNVQQIIEYANTVERTNKIQTLSDDGDAFSLTLDSFELWANYFDRIGMTSMKERILQVKIAYKELLYSGLRGEGTRLLDHGIASGLILLLYSTHFYKLYFTLKKYDDEIQRINTEHNFDDKTPRKDRIEAYLAEGNDNFKKLDKNDINILMRLIKSVNEYIPEHFVYSSRFWCTGILWATASVAFHNILQDPKDFYGYFKGKKIETLSLKGDALTYLGILVDIIEEWDRYQVNPDNVFGGNLPLQGIDVEIGVQGGDEKLVINYKNEKIARKVGENLTKSLHNWHLYIEIVGYKREKKKKSKKQK